ncbi:hypothetical protein JJB09_18505 [Rhizobium sp. KVB221]|uniref:Uncharacterized protein n=1 Tax=Rhizobium setariae TaxID=2801340 RepID=A0A937CNQ3_9HYPH|nr:hypothetical protein [Rhizobium setariae]MBL0374016.1 hypothetical protein [Rhizobium setariae]
MARIRSIHPGLFSDEAFVECSVAARLLVIGLWTEADDKGIFEWKPRTLKMRLFSADDFVVSELLDELLQQNIVRRYEIDGRSYGAIRNFRRYQRPKKPNDIHPMPPEFGTYVALRTSSSEPVGNQFGTGTELHRQMEDVGWRREGEGGNTQQPQPHGRPLGDTYTRDEFVDADDVVHDDMTWTKEVHQ